MYLTMTAPRELGGFRLSVHESKVEEYEALGYTKRILPQATNDGNTQFVPEATERPVIYEGDLPQPDQPRRGFSEGQRAKLEAALAERKAAAQPIETTKEETGDDEEEISESGE